MKVSRRETRVAAMRVVYAAISSRESGECAHNRFTQMSENERENAALADELMENIMRVFDLRRGDIDAWMEKAYGAAIDGITAVERATIAAATAEMLAYPQTPAAVIINEAVEISKAYGTEGGHMLVNGLLEKMGAWVKSG